MHHLVVGGGPRCVIRTLTLGADAHSVFAARDCLEKRVDLEPPLRLVPNGFQRSH